MWEVHDEDENQANEIIDMIRESEDEEEEKDDEHQQIENVVIMKDIERKEDVEYLVVGPHSFIQFSRHFYWDQQETPTRNWER